ncbi:MAG: hypothetical protein LBM02_06660 [Lachnospiraceae bacterium]|jgi:hypothetical protein|nr:hypothetical protein [Lachnospiraceae bacterium]
MEKKYFIKIFKKKTSTFLKISLTIFFLSLLLIISSVAFIFQQYIQSKNDFIENNNIHIIHISNTRSKNSLQGSYLKFSDIERLQQSIKGSNIFTIYNLGFGISDSKDNSFFLQGIDNKAFKFYNVEKLKDSQGYLMKDKDKIAKVQLNVPEISVDDGGFTSDKTKEITVLIKKIDKKNTLEQLNSYSDNTIIVNENTIKNIVKAMYKVSWVTYKKNYDIDNPYGVEIISEIDVYVKDFNKIRDVNDEIKREGYETSYVLSAFQDMQASLFKTYGVYISLLVFVLVISLINICFAYKNYIFSMEKDMGILRHMGYSEKEVFNMYFAIITNPYMKIVGVSGVYSLLLSIILLRIKFIGLFLILICLIALFFIVIIMAIVGMIKKSTRKNILDLLKYSKEAE